jgi:hypothetical protein
MRLYKTEIAFLRSCTPGEYRVGGTRGILSERSYSRLRKAGYLDEVWTWASRTRPDVSISKAGVDALRAAADATVSRNETP